MDEDTDVAWKRTEEGERPFVLFKGSLELSISTSSVTLLSWEPHTAGDELGTMSSVYFGILRFKAGASLGIVPKEDGLQVGRMAKYLDV